jgi:serine kinase of HPr protein (carbohydrate metabolism regulator)
VSESHELIHGTCVAFGPYAALIRGASGSGKSDLALRFLALPAEGGYAPMLVADDQIFVEARGNALFASVPPTIAGKLEVRGIGIVELPYAEHAELVLAVDLVAPRDVPRLPSEPWEQTMIAGSSVPCIALAPFEASAPLKLKLALFRACAIGAVHE